MRDDFGWYGGYGLITHVLGAILYGVFALLALAVVVGLLVFVVRFLVIGTRAAQLYIDLNGPRRPAPRGNAPRNAAPTPEAPPAPQAPPAPPAPQAAPAPDATPGTSTTSENVAPASLLPPVAAEPEHGQGADSATDPPTDAGTAQRPRATTPRTPSTPRATRPKSTPPPV